MVEESRTTHDPTCPSESSPAVPDSGEDEPVVESASYGVDPYSIVSKISSVEMKKVSTQLEREMTKDREYSSAVVKFFEGKSVLVTGGTGFLGKVLVEKILRSCPSVREVFLLLRAGRKGETPEQRLRKMLSESPFSYERDRHARVLSKVRAIAGDVSAPDLGLSPADRQLLISRVSIVFHSAANVTFKATLAEAVETNLQGTRRIIQLCKELPDIQSFVYVSTAFCNCKVKGNIEEKVLDAPCEPEWLIDKVSSMSPEELENSSRSLMYGHPNTYTLTKLLAEQAISKERGSFPTAIVRPSIVMGALQEPMPGWVDNVNGASAFLGGALYGVFRSILASDDAVADLVPSDLVVNQIITAAWSVNQSWDRTQSNEEDGCKGPLEVFHCTSGQVNPVTWGEFTSLGLELARQNPCHGVVWYPAGKCRRSPLRNALATALLHTIPSRALEVLSKMKGSTEGSRLVRLQRAYYKGMQHTHFVTTRQWLFQGSNSASLNRRLNEVDRLLFPSDPAAICWPSYLEKCVLGVRHFYLKQSPETLPKARRAMKKLKRNYLVAQFLMFAFSLYFGIWLTGSFGFASITIAVMLTIALRAL
ncbi:putative fatty acyl-CoA reductase CG5065 [Ischnura elegans]|uniref:putative fatty acyl-CoA reductase CG5065 n=1 Tax=Ischnura elegans TaxID=197161 RepID=UPI001ED8BE08|nr:putative fatty acyl-CoA reductase CG5065 [Ischnura elegans]